MNQKLTQVEYDALFADRQLKAARNHNDLFSKVVDKEFLNFYEKVKSNTMLSIESLYDFYLSMRYINAAEIPGSIVEVGTWKGGSLALAMLSDSSKSRNYIGYDTFEGHLQPEEDEKDVRGSNMLDRYKEIIETEGSWCKADYNETNEFLNSVKFAEQSFTLHKGDVKIILPNTNVDKLAILRVDCDWYAESLISLEVLYDRIVPGGIIILDDFGHHSGQRKAFDEFFSNRHLKWTHVNYATISAIKP
jgi:O-methyltransferase